MPRPALWNRPTPAHTFFFLMIRPPPRFTEQRTRCRNSEASWVTVWVTFNAGPALLWPRLTSKSKRLCGTDPQRRLRYNIIPGAAAIGSTWLRKPLLYPSELRGHGRDSVRPTRRGQGG
jgi:hypothetical protein